MTRLQFITLIGILLALFLGALDQTIVATALPKIVEDLQGLDRFSWVATSYLVASTALVPIYGKLADMYSHKKIEIVTIIIFLCGSALCGLSGEFGKIPLIGDGMNQLILFRAIQGIGGAGLFAMAFIIIAGLFPPAERGKYQGFVGAVFGLASVLGPWLGGLLTDHGSNIIPGISGWRWVFYVNIPFGFLALWFIITKMPAYKPAARGKKIDYFAAFLLISALTPLVIALQIDKSSYPWHSPITLGLLGLSALCLLLFYLRSHKSDNPILNFDLFKNKVFQTANPATFLLGAAFMCIIIFLPLFMINVVGVNATRAGLSMIPLSGGILLASIGSGQLVSRLGNYKALLLIGVIIFFIGVYFLSQLNANTSYHQVLGIMLICGLGMGPAMPLYPLAIQNAVPDHSIGQATSANQFFRQIGGAVGVSAMGALLTLSLSQSFGKLQQGRDVSVISTENLIHEGPAAIEEAFQNLANEQKDLLLQWYTQGDSTSFKSLIASNRIPEEVRDEIQNKDRRILNVQKLTSQIQKGYKDEEAAIAAFVKNSFGSAIAKIYQFLLYVVALAWLFTWFIPQIPLRKK